MPFIAHVPASIGLPFLVNRLVRCVLILVGLFKLTLQVQGANLLQQDDLSQMHLDQQSHATDTLSSSSDSVWVPSDLRLRGLQFFSVKEMREQLQCGAMHERNQFRESLESFAKQASELGFLSLEIKTTLDSTCSSVCELEVSEGERSFFGSIELLGLPASLQGLVASWPVDGVLHEEAFEDALTEILKAFDADSRPFASLHWNHMQWVECPKGLRLDLVAQVKNAHQLELDEIYFPGRDVCRKSTLLNLSRLEKGDLYCPKRLRDARRRLLFRDWFHEVSEAQLCRSKAGTAVLIALKEKPPYHFDGNLALLPPSQGEEKGRVAYDFKLDLFHLLGTGREVHVLASRPDGASQNLRFSYREPFVASLPLGIGVAIDQNLHHTRWQGVAPDDDPQSKLLWVERQVEAMVDLEPQGGFVLRAALRLRELLPDSLNGYEDLQLDRSLSRALYLSAEWDARDRLINPRNGYWASIERESQERKVLPFSGLEAHGENQSILRDRMHIKGWTGIHKNWVLHGHLGLGRIEARDPSIDELFALGGTQGPRGYRDGFFLCEEWALAQIEIRYILARQARIALFYDLLRYEYVDTLSTRQGRGFSLLLPAGRQLLEFQAAIAPKTPLREAYIHMRWIARF